MVSMIITTYNEGTNIGALLSDVLEQTRPPAELVIVDGGSTDDTLEVCESFRSRFDAADIVLVIKSEPGANIAAGRNIAIGLAAHECLCVTDAGCRLDPQWCQRITAPILEDRADFVGGFFRPVHHSRFQRMLAALTIANRPPSGFMPSSRSIAYTKAAWRDAGAYPEWLPWGEDTLFNEKCIAAGARYIVVADAIVRWEVRPTYRAAMKQFYRYAWGDGRRRRASVSHLLNSSAFLGSLALGIGVDPRWFLLFPIYCLVVTVRAAHSLMLSDLPSAFGIVVGIRVSRALGYIRGLIASVGRSESKG